jgi:hypothetical protein
VDLLLELEGLSRSSYKVLLRETEIVGQKFLDTAVKVFRTEEEVEN